jgi:hypothetical protein
VLAVNYRPEVMTKHLKKVRPPLNKGRV